MNQHEELRKMFDLPSMNRDIAESIGLEFDDFIEDVTLPVRGKLTTKPKKKLLVREQQGNYKPHRGRGIPFAKGDPNNPQKARWRCLECDMVSNIGGIMRHQKNHGHTGKQRVFETLEKLGVV